MANQLYVNYTLIISYNINVYCLKSKKINKIKYCNIHANDPKKPLRNTVFISVQFHMIPLIRNLQTRISIQNLYYLLFVFSPIAHIHWPNSKTRVYHLVNYFDVSQGLNVTQKYCIRYRRVAFTDLAGIKFVRICFSRIDQVYRFIRASILFMEQSKLYQKFRFQVFNIDYV